MNGRMSSLRVSSSDASGSSNKSNRGDGQQGAADRHPLLLAARQRAGMTIQQVSDAEQLEHVVEADRRRSALGVNQRPNTRFCRTVRCGKSRPSWNT